MSESRTPITIRTTTRVPATYEDIYEDWTPEKIRDCFGDDRSCVVVPLLDALEAAVAERDEALDALRKVLLYMRVDTPNACEAFDTARAILDIAMKGKM